MGSYAGIACYLCGSGAFCCRYWETVVTIAHNLSLDLEDFASLYNRCILHVLQAGTPADAAVVREVGNYDQHHGALKQLEEQRAANAPCESNNIDMTRQATLIFPML